MMANVYLSEAHAPVNGERTALDLEVKGRLPEDLSGLFARNSANPRFEPQGRYHWFDGDGMIHGVHFDRGRAHYRNRYIRTPQLQAEEDAGKALWSGILEPLDLSNPLGPMKDTANTDLVYHNGQLLALWWLSGQPQAISVPDLETLGPARFGGQLRHSVAAHSKVDPRTGDLAFFGFSVSRRPWYHFGAISADGSRVHAVDLDLPNCHIPHDIAITENFTLLLDLPLGWDRAALKHGKHRIAFDRETPGRIGVVPRWGQADEVRWFEIPACYVYHTISAHEHGQSIELVACRIEDMIPEIQDDSGRTARLDTIHLVPHLYRWVLDLETGEVHGEQLDDRATEFPRTNNQSWTRAARYSYNPHIAPRSALSFDGLVKYDLLRGGSEHRAYPEGWLGGEAVFAPRPGAREEDDGWILTALTHPDEPHSELWVLNGQDFLGEPEARVVLPWRIPLGFHAEWAPLEIS
jgi:carotenoid cleavage dioxygenase-like enzyme